MDSKSKNSLSAANGLTPPPKPANFSPVAKFHFANPGFKCVIMKSQTGVPCGKVFETKGALKRHQNSPFHRPEKQKFGCDFCSREYVFQTGLGKHMRDKHKANLDIHPSDEARGEEDSNFFVNDNDKDEDENDLDFFIDDNDEEEDDWDREVSGKRDASSKIQADEVDQRSLRSRRRQNLDPGLPLHGDPKKSPSSNNPTVAASGSHKNDFRGLAENHAQNGLSSNQPLQSSTKTILVCKLVNPKTGTVCNRVISSSKADKARSSLKRHQNGRLHCPEKSKSFKCSHCDKGYSNKDYLRYHMRDVHGVGVTRTAEFSDEESESSADDTAIPASTMPHNRD